MGKKKKKKKKNTVDDIDIMQCSMQCNKIHWFISFFSCSYPNGNCPQMSGRLKATATESRNPTLIDCKVHTGSFRVSVIHRTVTRTAGSLACVRDHSDARVYTQGGLGTPTASQHNLFESDKHSDNLFLCSWRRWNLGPLDHESDALPIKPPRHPV